MAFCNVTPTGNRPPIESLRHKGDRYQKSQSSSPPGGAGGKPQCMPGYDLYELCEGGLRRKGFLEFELEKGHGRRGEGGMNNEGLRKGFKEGLRRVASSSSNSMGH